MKLFLTTDDFVWKGVPRPGVPFLCDRQMELVAAPNQYLRYVATIRGRTRSEDTWLTYSQHLYEYFTFLEDNNLAWGNVDQAQIAAWRDAMLERGCRRSTVNQRLRCIHVFYKWAARSGMLTSAPFSTQDVMVAKPKQFLDHVDASGNRFDANELTLHTSPVPPPFLHMDKAIRFLDAMSPYRLKLMGYLALLTGMRRGEVVGLDYRVLPNPAGHDPLKQIKMTLDATLTPTKGQKTRTVMLPYDLAAMLWQYFCGDWIKLAALHLRKYGRETTRLFLSHQGDELSLHGFNNSFAKVATTTGIHCHPHMLRHTFGTYELLRMLQKVGELKALFWVRDRMGHSSITNTERYIHAVDLIRNDDVDGYQADICNALRRGH